MKPVKKATAAPHNLTRPATRSGFKASQVEAELNELLKIAAAGRSYLEVGARHGDTFYAVLRAMAPGGLGVAVDWPGGPWGLAGSEQSLRQAVERLSLLYAVHLVFGNSTWPDTVSQVWRLVPDGGFDLVFIDGDHSYEGVKSDWERYGPMGRIVAFHDINAVHIQQRRFGVPRLWGEIKASGARCQEFIAPGSGMGIGVTWRV